MQSKIVTLFVLTLTILITGCDQSNTRFISVDDQFDYQDFVQNTDFPFRLDEADIDRLRKGIAVIKPGMSCDEATQVMGNPIAKQSYQASPTEPEQNSSWLYVIEAKKEDSDVQLTKNVAIYFNECVVYALTVHGLTEQNWRGFGDPSMSKSGAYTVYR